MRLKSLAKTSGLSSWDSSAGPAEASAPSNALWPRQACAEFRCEDDCDDGPCIEQYLGELQMGTPNFNATESCPGYMNCVETSCAAGQKFGWSTAMTWLETCKHAVPEDRLRAYPLELGATTTTTSAATVLATTKFAATLSTRTAFSTKSLATGTAKPVVTKTVVKVKATSTSGPRSVEQHSTLPQLSVPVTALICIGAFVALVLAVVAMLAITSDKCRPCHWKPKEKKGKKTTEVSPASMSYLQSPAEVPQQPDTSPAASMGAASLRAESVDLLLPSAPEQPVQVPITGPTPSQQLAELSRGPSVASVAIAAAPPAAPPSIVLQPALSQRPSQSSLNTAPPPGVISQQPSMSQLPAPASNASSRAAPREPVVRIMEPIPPVNSMQYPWLSTAVVSSIQMGQAPSWGDLNPYASYGGASSSQPPKPKPPALQIDPPRNVQTYADPREVTFQQQAQQQQQRQQQQVQQQKPAPLPQQVQPQSHLPQYYYVVQPQAYNGQQVYAVQQQRPAVYVAQQPQQQGYGAASSQNQSRRPSNNQMYY